ncbi:GNAT family N-acetyltransferase, partial [Parvibaculum sp.]|uniref:GNAT family N-acetyltransferase n=1 Tax=Parvibaculum sp. TaxID=2024848 RepID=UPI002BFF13E2
EERKRLERELNETKKKLAMSGGGVAEASPAQSIGGINVVARVLNGVGGALCDAVETRARALGIARLFTEASKIARPVFERKGYSLIAEQSVTLNGVALTNYRMEKPIAP